MAYMRQHLGLVLLGVALVALSAALYIRREPHCQLVMLDRQLHCQR